MNDNLEKHLSTRSYLEGWVPTQTDAGVFRTLAKAPDATLYPHAARWYAHLASYSVTESAAFPAGVSASHDDFLNAFAAGTSAVKPNTDPSSIAAGAPTPADDDDIDLFGSDDEEDAEAERVKAERVAAYNARKADKPKLAAKSVVTMEVKPWDDETDMKALEAAVRSITHDGLVWGLSKLVPVGYGVSKLQINLVIEDEKISLDDLQEEIASHEDYVQSSDIAAMQKL